MVKELRCDPHFVLMATAQAGRPLAGRPVDGVGSCFSICLRKADDGQLGLVASCQGSDRALCITEILPNSAIAAWNKQSPVGKVVALFDLIVEVNGITCNEERMKAELNDHDIYLLRLTLVRGYPARGWRGNLGRLQERGGQW